MWVCEFVVRACMHVRVNPRVHPRIQCLNTTVCVLFYRTMLTACPPPPLPPLRTPIQIKKCIYCVYCCFAQCWLAAPHPRSLLSPSQYRSRSASTVRTVLSHNTDSLLPTSALSSPHPNTDQEVYLLCVLLFRTMLTRCPPPYVLNTQSGEQNTVFYSYLPCSVNTFTLNIFIRMSYTGLNRRNTLFLLLWLRHRNTWIPIQHVGPPTPLPPLRIPIQIKKCIYCVRVNSLPLTGLTRTYLYICVCICIYFFIEYISD